MMLSSFMEDLDFFWQDDTAREDNCNLVEAELFLVCLNFCDVAPSEISEKIRTPLL